MLNWTLNSDLLPLADAIRTAAEHASDCRAKSGPELPGTGHDPDEILVIENDAVEPVLSASAQTIARFRRRTLSDFPRRLFETSDLGPVRA